MSTSPEHLWIVGSRRADRASVLGSLPALPAGPKGGPVFRADAHRQLRGPYSGMAGVLAALVPDAHARWPELVDRHATEILSVAPDLRALVDPPLQTLTTLAVPEERTRFWSPKRTRRLAHGIVELLGSYAARLGEGPLAIVLDNVHAADHTDQELLAILLRRLPPARVRAIVATGPVDPTGPGGLTDELHLALATHARRVEAEGADGSDRAGAAWADDERLARAYVASDGTSDDPVERAAYERTDPGLRAALHDERADELGRLGRRSLELGAIPYHREHGSDPAGAGAEALISAIDHCVDTGLYHAMLDLAMRGRAIVDPDAHYALYVRFTVKAAFGLAAMGRSEEAEDLYLELRGRYAHPAVHDATSYALAMLYTRFHPEGRRDHHVARVYANNAVALASLLEDPQERAFRTVFNQNGLALVDTHLGDLEGARRLVTEGLERLDRELGPGVHRLHRSVLLHNRSQVYTALGRLQDALGDLDAVIAADPNYAEYWFDRGNLRRRLGDGAGALSDYEQAMRLSPPFYEAHYNRADLLASMGDAARAMDGFGYVLELEPDHVDSLVNRATLLFEAGEAAAAAADVERGLRIEPSNPHLLCTRGLLAMEAGDLDGARRSFTAALESAPDLHAALSNRAVAAYEEGDHDAAADDLTRALELAGDDADLFFNRGVAHQAAGRWDRAIHDFTQALRLPGADRTSLLWRRGLCREAAGDLSRARADLETCLGLEGLPNAGEVRERLGALARSEARR